MGGPDSGTRVGVQVLLLVALTVTLFAAAGYVPVLGIVVSLLAPTPLLLVVLRYGQRVGLLALGLSTLFLALLLGHFQSAIFFAEYGVMALTMAEAIRRKWSVERTLLISTAVPLLSTGTRDEPLAVVGKCRPQYHQTALRTRPQSNVAAISERRGWGACQRASRLYRGSIFGRRTIDPSLTGYQHRG